MRSQAERWRRRSGLIMHIHFFSIFGERLERKYWLPIGAVITLIGGILIVLSGQALVGAFKGKEIYDTSKSIA